MDHLIASSHLFRDYSGALNVNDLFLNFLILFFSVAVWFSSPVQNWSSSLISAGIFDNSRTVTKTACAGILVGFFASVCSPANMSILTSVCFLTFCASMSVLGRVFVLVVLNGVDNELARNIWDIAQMDAKQQGVTAFKTEADLQAYLDKTYGKTCRLSAAEVMKQQRLRPSAT
jgi:hypothetical protein